MEPLIKLENSCIEILQGAESSSLKIQKLMNLLQQSDFHLDWVGIYKMNDSTQELILGPYAGADTEHTRIPYGRGICGQVAVSGTTLNVPNVHEADNYLACSIETQSEIVIPIYHNGKLIAQLDIDSHQKNTFTQEMESFLGRLCDLLGGLLTS